MTFSEKANVKAASWTIGVHVALLLLFIFWRYAVPLNAQPVEMGMEVNLGTSDNGSGTDQPMSVEDPSAGVASHSYKAAANRSTASSKDMMHSNEADAPSIHEVMANKSDRINNTDYNKRKRSNQQDNNSANHRQEKLRYVYNGASGRGGNNAMQNMPGTSEGNTTGKGDRGVPGGTPGSANYVGSPGNGNGGINYQLDGRNIVAYPQREASFNEEGRVVMHITVNRDGVIVNKQIISASSSQLRTLALHKIEKVRFNKSLSAPEEQFGIITFVFKTRS